MVENMTGTAAYGTPSHLVRCQPREDTANFVKCRTEKAETYRRGKGRQCEGVRRTTFDKSGSRSCIARYLGAERTKRLSNRSRLFYLALLLVIGGKFPQGNDGGIYPFAVGEKVQV
jgi:hypothetical protein